MPFQSDLIYRTRDQIVDEMVTAWLTRVPDQWLAEDSVARILTEVMATSLEGVYLMSQLLHDAIWPQTAQGVDLERFGDQYGLEFKLGTQSSGELNFSGLGGTVITAGRTASTEGVVAEPIYFDTQEDGTIPNPGNPTAPTLADDAAVSTLAAGAYEYVVTFLTDEGETIPGVESAILNLIVNHTVAITNIPVGGPGTTGRRIYRQRDGNGYKLVTTIADNVTVAFNDAVADVALGAAPPLISTAEAITVTAKSRSNGLETNVANGTITTLVDVPDGVTGVTNPSSFVGGSDPEDHEVFRLRLLVFIRNPGTGSAADLKSWAEDIEGVESATVFSNDNLGVATNGHVTVRISGPQGTIPPAEVIAAVLADLTARDLADVTIHVATFTQVAVNVTTTTTRLPGYSLPDVTPSVQQAIIEYINSVPVGGTLYRAGLTDAIFGLPGIATLTVDAPAVDQVATAIQKFIPGTLTVL